MWDNTYGKHGVGGFIGDIWDGTFGANDPGSWQNIDQWTLQDNPAANLWDESLGVGGLGGAIGDIWDSIW